jgi:glycolate oxidase FAD binding subunit
MAEPPQPRDQRDVCDAVADAGEHGYALEIIGGGSKRGVGAPGRGGTPLSMAGMTRIIDYDPAELVLTLEPGALLSDVEAMLRDKNQMLAFDPWDFAETVGGQTARSTIGGVIGAGIAGSRRISAGGVRDHVLGFAAVNGRGEAFKAGGRVVKNVTGYDLSKLVTGAWGQLVVLTEITLKVAPLPQGTRTLFLRGLDAAEAILAMGLAMRAPVDVAAASHLPGIDGEHASITAVRVEGFEASLKARMATLAGLFAELKTEEWPDLDAARYWRRMRRGSFIRDEALPVLWRISIPPSRGAAVLAQIENLDGAALLDWAGGLLWARTPLDASPAIRALAEAAGGHAMLVDAPGHVRAATPALHPEAENIAALSRRVRRAFDPNHVFDPKRFEAAAP